MIGQELDLQWMKDVKAVIKVFVDLYNKKLIYKDKKLVNWDTSLQTAISDLEVVQKEVNHNFIILIINRRFMKI